MAPSPEDRKRVTLSDTAIEEQFDCLNIREFLNRICHWNKVNPPKVTIRLSSIQHPRPFDWKAEKAVRNSDGEPMAVVHLRKRVDGSEDRQVQWFEAPDGTIYERDIDGGIPSCQ